MNQESPSQELVPLKKRRARIPDKPNYSLNLWSIMKNCIGKELSKIPMPVSNFLQSSSAGCCHTMKAAEYIETKCVN